MDNSFNGIVESLELKTCSSGALAGKTFVLKDLFDVAGYVTGAGNPDWKRSHEPAVRHAAALQILLDAGAQLVAKSCTDELAFSLDGINIHYGTPVNPNYSGCIPGGSSSGSASAVATGICDFGIGTDTAGSVRVPSAYCGIFGMRPSHGRVSVAGVVPLGLSFDTVGWMSRSPELLRQVGRVLLGFDGANPNSAFPSTFVFVKECMNILQQDLFKPFLAASKEFLGLQEIETVSLPEEALENWAKLFDIIRAYEAWQQHSAWMQQVSPKMAEPIKNRFFACSATTLSDYEDACEKRKTVVSWLSEFLSERILCVPTIWNCPPALGTSEDDLAVNRRKNLLLNSISSLGGLPQIVIPVSVPGLAGKFSISLIAGPGQDESLLEFVNSAFDLDQGRA